jgi:RNA methyltransferase, TrmH family
MMALSKLSRLHGIALERKCSLLLEAIERDLAVRSGRDEGEGSLEAVAEGLTRAAGIASFLAESPEASSDAAQAAREYCEYRESLAAGESPSPESNSSALPQASSRPDPRAMRALNGFRHALRLASGQSTADWDLVDHGRRDLSGEGKRLPGLRVFLEDIRSPFNVGSILRTAEAFGFEEVLLSPGCADPTHPRAVRSSMGAVDLIPWRRSTLQELSGLGPIIVLELGGRALADFVFPERGVLVLGSEELGVSEPALALAGQGRVSIPMRGAKASINVSVAFGIAAQAWASSAAALAANSR